MKTYAALFRGINVSGQKKMPMATLRQQLEELDLTEVNTYIQSGNIVFRSEEDKAQLTDKISKMIYKEYGFEVPVLILTADDIEDTLKNNPFLPEKRK